MDRSNSASWENSPAKTNISGVKSGVGYFSTITSLTSYIATLPFLTRFVKTDQPDVLSFLETRAQSALSIIDKHLAGQPYMASSKPTVADLSMCGYVYFEDELGLSLSPYVNVNASLERIKSLPGWKHPYDLMPSAQPTE